MNLKFAIDCSHPVEDGILNMAEFVSWSLTITMMMIEPNRPNGRKINPTYYQFNLGDISDRPGDYCRTLWARIRWLQRENERDRNESQSKAHILCHWIDRVRVIFPRPLFHFLRLFLRNVNHLLSGSFESWMAKGDAGWLAGWSPFRVKTYLDWTFLI